MIKGRRGFGTLEAMVGAGIFAIAVTMALLSLQPQIGLNKNMTVELSLQAARITVVGLLQDPVAWMKTVDYPANANLSCIKGGDCTGASGAFALLDSSGAVYYNSQAAGSGFTSAGQPCSTFNATTPDPNCPYQLSLSWTAICAASPCSNPQVLIQGSWIGSVNSPMNLSVHSFSVVLPSAYCIPQPAVVWSVLGGQVNVVANSQVVATVGGTPAPPPYAGSAITTDLESCGTYTMTYFDSVQYSNGATQLDAANAADICFYNSLDNPNAPVCIYEWTQLKGNWTLSAFGAAVTSGSGVSSGMNFQFNMNKGQMTFFVNKTRSWVSNQFYFLPLRVKASPSSTDYSPAGFSAINFSF